MQISLGNRLFFSCTLPTCLTIVCSRAIPGVELEWQRKLHTAQQKSAESLTEFAARLRMLADRSFPSWKPIDRLEMVRNQFINGVLSSTIQLKLLQEQPPALDDAVTLATQLEAVELAQRSLQTTKLTTGVSDHTSDRHTAGASGDHYQELVAQVRSLSQQLGRLHADSGETGENKRGACWKCGRPGHFRNCPQRRPTKGKTTPERSAEFTSAVACTLTLQGEVEGRITPMLVDTGSSVTLLHERVWKEAVQGRRKLQPSAGPVKAVNGENLPICGQAEVSFQVGEYVGVHKVLVVKEMIQECLLGTDFLEKGDCVIDVKNKLLTIAGCTKPVRPILLLCKHNKRRPCTFSWLHNTLIQHPLYHIMHQFYLMEGQPAGCLMNGRGISCINLVT